MSSIYKNYFQKVFSLVMKDFRNQWKLEGEKKTPLKTTI